LKNLGHHIDIVSDENIFLNKVEEHSYTFVIYDISPFKEMKCMVSDIIKDNGSRPFVILGDDIYEEEECFEVFPLGITAEEIAQKLQDSLNNEKVS
ncbi:MAG: hypothetical protein Q9M36_04630, partial [Sulfurovum sp.]|nr:hypothetical protein [Sulfurovum sp.]